MGDRPVARAEIDALHRHSGQQMQQPASSARPVRSACEGRDSHDESRQRKAREEKNIQGAVRRYGLGDDESSGPDQDENSGNGESKQGGKASSGRRRGQLLLRQRAVRSAADQDRLFRRGCPAVSGFSSGGSLAADCAANCPTEALSATARAASPLTSEFQLNSSPLRFPLRVILSPSGDRAMM